MKRIFICAFAVVATFFTSGAHAGNPIRICTGAADGNYYAAGRAIAQTASKSIQIEVIETTGTGDNLDRAFELAATDAESCDAIIGQPDGVLHFVKSKPAYKAAIRQVGELHREYLHVVCSKPSGIDDLGDLDGTSNYSLAIGEPLSGGWYVWQNIVAEDTGYAKVPTVTEGGVLALSAVASDSVSCMLVPAGLGNGTIASANDNYASSVALVGANDKDFNDALDVRGKPLYQYANIPGKLYKKLLCGTFSCSNPSTISWRAGVYVNTERFTDRKILASFADAVGRATPQIVSAFGG